MQTPPLHKQNKRTVRHPPSPDLAYVILEQKCGLIVPRTRDCFPGKSIKSSLLQYLVTQLTSNFIIMGLRGAMVKWDHKKGFRLT